MISIIAALGKNRALGKNNELLWRTPDDLKRFKSLTMGHPIVMGRKTFESIGKPLPGRTNIVITHHPEKFQGLSLKLVGSLEEALAQAKEAEGGEETFVIGGAQIYKQALPHADRLYLTLIDDEKEADAYFPEYEKIFTKKLSDEFREFNGLKYRWIDLER